MGPWIALIRFPHACDLHSGEIRTESAGVYVKDQSSQLNAR